MFTDNPTIPARLEVLLDVLHIMRERKVESNTIRALLQPAGLPGLGENSSQADHHLAAARELKLTETDAAGSIRLTYRVRGEHHPKSAILAAFDSVALGSAAVEFWAARFYGFLITQRDDFITTGVAARETLTQAFNAALPSTVERANPMNPHKLLPLMRWYTYVGLGWVDPDDRFIPDPSVRIERSIKTIFGKERSMDSGAFMARIASVCPELDGGKLFLEGAGEGYSAADRTCTRALAISLRNLHDKKVIKLFCPRDSRGWNLTRAGSVIDPGVLDSDLFDSVTLI